MALRSPQLVALMALPIALLGLPSVARAQALTPVTLDVAQPSGALAPARLSEIKLNILLTPAEASPVPAWAQRDEPDSLTNGTLIGAIVGATIAGVTGGVICKLFQEPDDPSCAGDTFRVAAVGAAIGAGAGIAIDASMSRQGGVRFAVKKRF